VIFIDRSIPKGVATALKAVRDDVKWLEDEFTHSTPDEDWLRDVAQRGWVVVSRDKKIRTRPRERQAIVDSGAGVFCLTQNDNPTRWKYLQLLCLTLDQMEFVFTTTSKPFLFGVDRTGGLRRIF
jgi:hypothetical protein